MDESIVAYLLLELNGVYRSMGYAYHESENDMTYIDLPALFSKEVDNTKTQPNMYGYTFVIEIAFNHSVKKKNVYTILHCMINPLIGTNRPIILL